MNNTVSLKGVNRALLAATWCNNNVPTDEWTMQLSATIFADGDYNFTFSNPDHASMFALRWR